MPWLESLCIPPTRRARYLHSNLHGNNFHGSPPQMFTNESMLICKHLSDNQLQGKVPQFLIKCSKLQVLNLGHTQISDTFPFGYKVCLSYKFLCCGRINFMVLYGILVNLGALKACVLWIYLLIILVEAYHQNTL